jgi:hypothetical protein
MYNLQNSVVFCGVDGWGLLRATGEMGATVSVERRCFERFK